MPVAFSVTKASDSEQTETKKLLEKMEKEHKEWLEGCRYFLGDKGYDSGRLIEQLERKGIRPVIDIRNCWKDGEETHQYRDTNLVYNYKGTVWYVEENGSRTELLYRGYDKSTDSLRYGFKPQRHDKRIFRIKCEEDRRIFTPVARNSHKWKRLYKKRTGVERINGRIDLLIFGTDTDKVCAWTEGDSTGYNYSSPYNQVAKGELTDIDYSHVPDIGENVVLNLDNPVSLDHTVAVGGDWSPN